MRTRPVQQIAALVLGLAAIQCAPTISRAQNILWTGYAATNSANTNWSAAANWSGGAPSPATNIFFFDPGANLAAGAVLPNGASLTKLRLIIL